MSRELGQTTKHYADSINIKIGFRGAFHAIQQQIRRFAGFIFAVPLPLETTLLVRAERTRTV